MGLMVVGLALVATAVSSLFAQSMLARSTRLHRPQDGAWAVALAMFALASAALVTGTATGWDAGAFRVFYLFGAILSVPWLALGTVHLLASPRVARRVRQALFVFSGFAAGVRVSAPVAPVAGTTIPVGKDVLGVLPRVLAAASSGLAAVVIVVGAVLSAVRYARDRSGRGSLRLAGANALIALGTLVLSSGGLIQGALGHDQAFTLSLAAGISVIYAGFLVAASRDGTNR
ncbi:MAG TPA: hypothetical protein VMQ81_02275 [Acidimicrobiia bacterium]|nr:hypothetical protein [Acidimicrobiia bacterium]